MKSNHFQDKKNEYADSRALLVGDKNDQTTNETKNDLARSIYKQNEISSVNPIELINDEGGISLIEFLVVYMSYVDENPNQLSIKAAQDFAEKLNQMFSNVERVSLGVCSDQALEKKLDKRLELKDLYLIGSNAGLIHYNNDNKNSCHVHSFAAYVANELSKKGFAKVKVHAISQPKKLECDQLKISVVSDGKSYQETGLYCRISAEYLLCSSHSEQQDSKQYKVYFENKNPLVELNKPENIFLPHETLSERIKRIESSEFITALDEYVAQREANQKNYFYSFFSNIFSKHDYDLKMNTVKKIKSWLTTAENQSPVINLTPMEWEAFHSGRLGLVCKEIQKTEWYKENHSRLKKLATSCLPANSKSIMPRYTRQLF